MATLAEAVDAGETDWTISADTTADFLTVESETVAVLTHFPVQLDPQTRLPLPPRIRVQRGAGGTTAASHADGTTLTPLIPPASSGGGGGAIVVTGTDASGDPIEVAAAISLALTGMNLSESAPGIAELFVIVDEVIKWLVSGDGSGQLEIQGMNLRLSSIDGADETYLQVTPTGITGLLAQDSGEFRMTARNGAEDGGELFAGPGLARLASGGSAVVEVAGGEVTPQLGFYGASPVLRPEIPASPTEQDIADALVLLGLVTQAV